jgi:hypothetical protein
MEEIPFTHYLEHMIGALAKFGMLAIILPLIPVLIFNLSLPATVALMTTTFVVEYGAAPIGIGLGLHPVFVLYVLVCIASGITLFLFDIFDTLGEHSERIAKFLQKSAERAKKSRILSKYGMYGLVPCVMTLGFYVCPPVVWVFGWRRDLSILTIMAGYISISVVTIFVSLGIIDIVFK